MSTKISIAYGDKYHFYQECFDTQNVYLTLEGFEFEVTDKEATVQIPVTIFKEMIAKWNTGHQIISDPNQEQDWLDSLDHILTYIKDKQ